MDKQSITLKGGDMTNNNKAKKATKQTAIEIYVGEEKMSVAQTVKAQVNYLSMPTPEKYIMQRKGRGNLMLDYVETNYVIGRLNATFFFDWDSEIIEQIIDKDNNQIAMKIRLTVRFANSKEVKKDAWGGSAIKFSGTKMIDLADDLKSAESDGIKKAASMLGICWDVYSGLTGNGKKKKSKATNKDGGFDDIPRPPDAKSEFRTIPITIGNKTVLHTKYEALGRFKKAKDQLSEELYYKILGENGYEKANQIPNDDLPKLYYALVEAYKGKKKSTIGEKITQKELIELSRLETILIDKHDFSPNQILNQFKETVGESDINKMTKGQIVKMADFFKKCIKELNESAKK